MFSLYFSKNICYNGGKETGEVKGYGYKNFIGKCLIYFRNIRVKIVKKNENIGDLVYIFEKMYVIICSVVIL